MQTPLNELLAERDTICIDLNLNAGRRGTAANSMVGVLLFVQATLALCHLAGNPELGGQVATASVPGHAAPSTPMNDPEKWEGRHLTLKT